MAEDFDIEILRAAVAEGRIQWHLHALERFLERGISRAEVINAINNGEVINQHLSEGPPVSKLPHLSYRQGASSRCGLCRS